MPKFNVEISEMVLYSMVIEADTREEAEKFAEEEFVHSQDVNKFFEYVDQREIHAVPTEE